MLGYMPGIFYIHIQNIGDYTMNFIRNSIRIAAVLIGGWALLSISYFALTKVDDNDLTNGIRSYSSECKINLEDANQIFGEEASKAAKEPTENVLEKMKSQYNLRTGHWSLKDLFYVFQLEVGQGLGFYTQARVMEIAKKGGISALKADSERCALAAAYAQKFAPHPETVAPISAVPSDTSPAADGKLLTSRGGKLEIVESDGPKLFFNGKNLLQGNSSLSIVKSFSLGDTDIALVENIGGTGCPALFTLVSINTQGAVQISPEFGTCAENMDAKLDGDSIIMSMSGFTGPFSPDEAQQQAANELHAFVYKAGVVHHFTPKNGAMTEVNL